MLFLPGRGCYINPKQSGLQTRHHGEYQINCFAVRHSWKSPCVSSSHCTDWSFPITQWHSWRKANQRVQVSGPTQTHLRTRNAPHTMRVKCWTHWSMHLPTRFLCGQSKNGTTCPSCTFKVRSPWLPFSWSSFAADECEMLSPILFPRNIGAGFGKPPLERLRTQ